MFDGHQKELQMKKSRQENNERGQEENKKAEGKCLKIDSLAAFKQLCASSGSQKTNKEMLGSSP